MSGDAGDAGGAGSMAGNWGAALKLVMGWYEPYMATRISWLKPVFNPAKILPLGEFLRVVTSASRCPDSATR